MPTTSPLPIAHCPMVLGAADVHQSQETACASLLLHARSGHTSWSRISDQPEPSVSESIQQAVVSPFPFAAVRIRVECTNATQLHEKGVIPCTHLTGWEWIDPPNNQWIHGSGGRSGGCTLSGWVRLPDPPCLPPPLSLRGGRRANVLGIPPPLHGSSSPRNTLGATFPMDSFTEASDGEDISAARARAATSSTCRMIPPPIPPSCLLKLSV